MQKSTHGRSIIGNLRFFFPPTSIKKRIDAANGCLPVIKRYSNQNTQSDEWPEERQIELGYVLKGLQIEFVFLFESIMFNYNNTNEDENEKHLTIKLVWWCFGCYAIGSCQVQSTHKLEGVLVIGDFVAVPGSVWVTRTSGLKRMPLFPFVFILWRASSRIGCRLEQGRSRIQVFDVRHML